MDVKESTKLNCWKHVGIIHGPSHLPDEDNVELLDAIHTSSACLGIDPIELMTPNNYISVHIDISTEEIFDDKIIIELITEGSTSDTDS